MNRSAKIHTRPIEAKDSSYINRRNALIRPRNPLKQVRKFNEHSCLASTAIGCLFNVFLQIGHHFLQRLASVGRVHCVGEITNRLPLRRNVLRAETRLRVETGSLTALPTDLADPATTHFEQLATALALFTAQVHHQRADQFGFEQLENIGGDQPSVMRVPPVGAMALTKMRCLRPSSARVRVSPYSPSLAVA